MLLIPLGGWLLVSVSPFAVPTVLFDTVSWPSLPLSRDEGLYKVLAFLHGKGAMIGFLGLLLLHIAGAIKHVISDESGVLKRILPGRKTDTSAETKGLLTTLLLSLGFFLAVAAIPLFSQNGSVAAPVNSVQSSLQPNWDIIDDGKSIRFNFSHDGGDYTGRFESWDAQIEFYEDNLSRSRVQVQIDLASAITGKKLYDDSLKAPEWFDVKTKPKATVTLERLYGRGDIGTQRY